MNDPIALLQGKPTPPQKAFFESKARHTAYGGARGGGKAQPVDEPVLTPFGFRRMGELNVGSIVSNPDGGTARVIQVHPQGVKPVYRVTFIDGATTRCTGDHLWLAAKTGTDTGEKIYTTERLKEFAAADSFNLLIPLCEPVNFTRPTRSAVPVKPYTMGVLIGDGCLVGKTASFVSADEQIVLGVVADGYKVSEWNADRGIAKSYGMIEFMPAYETLREIGLGVTSDEKFIPDVYKYLPVDERMALIQGLMDTDGYADSRGHCSFSTTSKRLADDMAWLIRSIGGKATITDSIGKYKKDGQVIECKMSYDLYIQTKRNADLFRLDRKRDRCRDEFNGGVSELKRRIVSIEPCGEAECQCITVDNPNGLYITKDFIVTHNSWAMRRKMVGLGLAPYGGIRMLLLRRSFPELLGNHIRPLIEELVPSGMAKYNKDEKIFIFPNGSYIKLGFCDSEDDWMQYQGQEYEVIGFEEATNFTELQMRKIATSNRTSRKDFKPRCYYTCNPGGVGHEYIKRLFVDRNFITEPIMFEGMEILPEDPNDYVFIRAKLSDNPHVDSDYIKSLAGLPEHLRRAYLEGDWDVVLGQYFSEFRRDLHVIPTMAIPPEWKRFRSMDWGFNDPWATLWFAVAPDRHIYVYRELYAREINSSDYARMVKQMTGADENISGTYLSPDAWQRRGMKDISGGENIAEVLMRNGIPVFKADNSRVIGWQRVRENLAIAPDGKPWLQIMDCCTNLIRTMPNLTVDPNDIEDVSDHCEDHAAEALRYGLMSRPSPKTIRPAQQMVGNLYVDPFNQRRTQPRSTNFYDLK